MQRCTEQTLLVATRVVLRLAATLLKYGKLEVPPSLTLVLDHDYEQFIPHQLLDACSNSQASFPLWDLQDIPLSFQPRAALVPLSTLKTGTGAQDDLMA